MAKKSSALKQLEEKRKKARGPLKVDSIVSERPQLISRPAEAVSSEEEAQREDEIFLRSLVSPDTGKGSEKDVEVTVVAPPPPKVKPGKQAVAQRVKDAMPSQGTVSPQTTVLPQDTVSQESTVSSLSEMLDTHPKIRQGVQIETNYTKYDNNISNYLAPLQTVYEQVVYSRLYRLSWGYQRDACFIGYGGLTKGCGISKSSTRRAISGLVVKGHIEEIEGINNKKLKGTIYRVRLPHEVLPDLSQDTMPSQGTVSPQTTVLPQDTVSQESTVSSLSEMLDTHPKIRQGVQIETNYTKYDNNISNYLAPLQTVYEQVVYSRLYRLSWGYQRDACFIGYGGLTKGCGISKSSTRRAISGLVVKGHIEEIEGINNKKLKGTIYRVRLPHEVLPDLSQDAMLPQDTVSPQTTVLPQDTASSQNTVVSDTVLRENTVFRESTWLTDKT